MTRQENPQQKLHKNLTKFNLKNHPDPEKEDNFACEGIL